MKGLEFSGCFRRDVGPCDADGAQLLLCAVGDGGEGAAMAGRTRAPAAQAFAVQTRADVGDAGRVGKQLCAMALDRRGCFHR
eukprot:3717550-Pleurochrysis_carterae.AAC.1